MKTGPNSKEERILIAAASSEDALSAGNALKAAGLAVEPCNSLERLPSEIQNGIGGILIAEVALTSEVTEILLQALNNQPTWSELPILLLADSAKVRKTALRSLEMFAPRASVTLVEQPICSQVLITAAQVAVRSRRRQYQVRDLLAQRESDRMLVQTAQQEAETANRAKVHFLATLSHELRLPLTPVLLTLSGMADDPETPASLREQVEFMRRNVQLEARLIDDLLDLTRIMRGQLTLEYEPVDVHTQLRQAVAICRASSPEGAPIRLSLEAKHHRSWGDRTRIQQIFWNLLANATKFTPPEGRINVRTWDGPDERLHVELSDTGIGLKPEEISQLFGAFQQGNRGVARTFGGLGLGLAITRNLLDMHQGTISVTSEGRGRGSTFTLTLPALLVPTGARAPERRPARLDRSLQVLLVEDDPATLSALSRLLRKDGHQVTTASRIDDGIVACRARSFDLLICDLGLPDGSGVDLIRHLRSSEHAGPAIAMSGLGMDEDIQASKEAGFDRHLVKPVDWQQLRSVIAELAQRKPLRRKPPTDTNGSHAKSWQTGKQRQPGGSGEREKSRFRKNHEAS